MSYYHPTETGPDFTAPVLPVLDPIELDPPVSSRPFDGTIRSAMDIVLAMPVPVGPEAVRDGRRVRLFTGPGREDVHAEGRAVAWSVSPMVLIETDGGERVWWSTTLAEVVDDRESTAPDPTGWVDRHGDVWREGADGLMHTPETRPFPREHVEKKWGPLRPVSEVPAERDPQRLVSVRHDDLEAVLDDYAALARMRGGSPVGTVARLREALLGETR